MSRPPRRLLVALLLLAACAAGPPRGSGPSASVAPRGSSALPPLPGGGGARLELRLSEAMPEGDEETPRARTVAGQELTRSQAAGLLARLPELVARRDDRSPFALRPTSAPAPRPGRTVEQPFPPPAGRPPAEAPTGPLEVLRYGPEGEIPGAPSLSVTFSQPMVPVGRHDEIARRQRPVELVPETDGAWRWVGSRTLLFEPEGGFPGSTRWEATVPAGTRSLAGGSLASALRWGFETPRLKLVRHHPTGSSVPLRPVMVLGFDQRVDAGAVARHVNLLAGRRGVPLRRATDAELAADEGARHAFDALQDGHRLALVAERALPAGTGCSIVLRAGAPSAEGPLLTTADQSASFATRGPLRVTGHRCGWNDECRPGWPWSVSFSNPLDVEAFDPAFVTVEPALRDVTVDASGAALTIRGLARARTTYSVRVDARLRDVFGQTLGQDAVLGFRVGEAWPELRLATGDLVVLEPKAPRALPAYSIGYGSLHVEVRAVTPDDWEAWTRWRRERRRRGDAELPGRVVTSRSVKVAEVDELVETPIDIAPALRSGLGHAIVRVTADRAPRGRGEPPSVEAWVQSTRLGIDALVDAGEMVAWTTDLQSGAPLAGLQIALEPAGTRATSDLSGLSRLGLPSGPGAALLVARRGEDVAFLPQNRWAWDRGWRARERTDRLLWHVFDDRGLYRPGESARLKGWVRQLQVATDGDTVLPVPAPTAVAWTVSDPRGNEVAEGSAPVSALGGFDLEVSLPADTNLGEHQVRLRAEGSGRLPGASFARALSVQEFRRPEYEVTTRVGGGPFFGGGEAGVTVTAGYYAGGPLPGAEVTWRVTQSPGSFRPPGWQDFRFGRWIPWWWEPWPVLRGGFAPWPEGGPPAAETLSGTTDAQGEHHLAIGLGTPDPPLPVSVTAEATVQDVSRQAWSASSALLVHPASVTVGLRTTRAFVEEGQPLDVDVVVTDLDGTAVPGRPVVVAAERSKSRWLRGGWQEEWVDRMECARDSVAEPVRCTFRPETGGRWRVRAVVTDEEGRSSLTEITAWVSGGDALPSRGVEQEKVELVPDAEEFRPGAVARLLVQAPFAPAEGLLSTRRDGLVEVRRFSMESATTVLELPIAAAHVPNLHVVVELDGEQVRAGADGRPDPALPKRPAFARGAIDLKVPPVDRALRVSVEPAARELEPGVATTVRLAVTGAGGEPVAGAEVAVVVADEAVLALTGYEILDPLDTFHPPRRDDVASERSRALLLLGEREELGEPGGGASEDESRSMMKSRGLFEGALAPAPMAMAAEAEPPGGSRPPIALRTDFDPLALFAPMVRTDARGRAVVDLELPDNLTRYRVFAVAVAGHHRAGTGESSITARLPVMARLQAPRFLNFGDRLELPLVVQNLTDAARTVDVALRSTNLVLDGVPGRRVEVPPRDRVEVRFPAGADEAGTARVQVAVASGAFADAAEVALPVWTPATTEAFAAHGELDEGAVLQPLRVPGDVFTQFGGLEVTTSSTALQGLTDAVIYLVQYPFDCAEQRASRVLAIAALRDVLVAFDAEGLPSPEELRQVVGRDLEELARRQNADGGFGFWRRGEESRPFLSVHVAHALARAEAKGYEVPRALRGGSLRYLQGVENALERLGYSEAARRATLAQALCVRALLGDADPGRARRLLREAGIDGLSLESLGWLLPTLAADGASGEVAGIRRHLLNRVSETSSTAEFSTSYGDDAWRLFHSSRRSDAVLLEALVRVEPDLDLIPKLARGLLAHRKRGRWGSTQENAWVLLALDAYFREHERATPDFVARAWIGEGLALEQAYRGRSTDRHRVDVPMGWLAEGPAARDLVLAKDGPGRLYWRVAMRYAPRNLQLEPASHGFEVERTYAAVDDDADVSRDEDGTWRVRAGARVRVRVTMATPARRYHVALVDPLPAGFEALDPALAVTGAVPPEAPETSLRPWGWWWGRWHEHDNLRDERAEAFASLLWPGAHAYAYVCRATTPGRFVVPPPRAEEMYAPETFGRGASDVVIVE